MLEKDPANRPQNAVELRREIDDCLDAVRQSPATPDRGSRRAETRPRPQSGTVVKSRYQVGRPLGEGTRGRMFEGRDTQADGAAVTITFLSAQRLPDPADVERLGDEVRLVQAAAHPHLAQVFAFERAANGQEAFLVEEAINGGTLVDLLAARGGPLSTVETLRLLGQAAAAADHAASRRLEHLGLAVHQVCLHFEAADMDDARGHLSAAMKEWPRWALKIDPLATIGESAEVNTWTGDVTLVPGVNPVDGWRGAAFARRAGRRVPALARGADLRIARRRARRLAQSGGSGRPVQFSARAERGSEHRAAAGVDRAVRLVAQPPFLRGAGSRGGVRPGEFAGGPGGRDALLADARADRRPPTRRSGSPGAGSQGGPRRRSPEEDEVYPEGSIADRLTLVSERSIAGGTLAFGVGGIGRGVCAGGSGCVDRAGAARLPRRSRKPTRPSELPHPRRIAARRVRPARWSRPRCRRKPSHHPHPTPATPIAEAAPPVAAPATAGTARNATVIVRVKSIPTGAEISWRAKRSG